MTRDEAIKKATEGFGPQGIYSNPPKAFVEMAIALGLLQIDEPIGPNERAVDAMFAEASNGMLTPRHALAAIRAAGLRIVES